MVLDSMIRAAKTRPVRRVQDMALEATKYAPNPNRGRIIGDDDNSRPGIARLVQAQQVASTASQAAPQATYSNGSGSRGTSITAIAQEMSGPKTFAHAPGVEITWQSCKCKVAAGTDRYLCKKFNIVCAKEKCPSKFIEV